MDVEIHPAAASDMDLLAALHGVSFAPESGKSWTAGAIAKLLEMPGAEALIGIRSVDPTPLGFVMFRIAADECEIISLGVVPEARRLGVAADLLTQLFHRAALAGVAKVFLEVAEDNLPALSFYRCQNFTQVGVRRNYYRRHPNARIDARILQCKVAVSG